jgi:solute carrier family 35 protein E3
MAERSADRAPSVSSSVTEAEAYDENEKNGTRNSTEVSFIKVKSPEDLEIGDEVERAELLPADHEKPPQPTHDSSVRSAFVWMVVNTLATIGIVSSKSQLADIMREANQVLLQVFTNKAIFSDPTLKLAQLTFAAFHFFITWLTLFTLSRPRFAMFTPRRVAIKEIIPLAVAMSLNVILPNLSLAFSTVTFYQVARILLTPMVALMNFVLYKSTLPRNAIYALIPACVGVSMVSYYDSLPSADASIKTTSSLGVIFAFSGIFASSLYTVWISSYHKKLQMNSMQLLFNQAPLAAFMLLYVIPFVDTFPVWTEVPINRWIMIMMVRYSFLNCCFCNWFQILPIRICRAQLTFIPPPVRHVRLHNQYVPILHHRTNWPCFQHCGWSCENMLHCGAGLGHFRSCCGR